MKQHRLYDGRDVSVLSIGSWQTVEATPFEDTVDILARAYELGINFFDTARYAYVPPNAQGEAQPIPPGSPFTEVIFGRALALAGIPREGFALSEKVWYDIYPQLSFADQLDASMRRLGVEYVDLVLCQVPQPGMDSLEIGRQMSGLVSSGRARCWGVVNWSPAQMRAVHAAAREEGFTPPSVMEVKYSMVRRVPAESSEYRALCADLGMTIHASNTLEGGLLVADRDLSDVAARRILPEDTRGVRAGFMPQREAFRAVAAELGVAPVQLAVAFVVSNPDVCSALLGMTKVAQVDVNVEAVELAEQLGAETIREKLARFAADTQA